VYEAHNVFRKLLWKDRKVFVEQSDDENEGELGESTYRYDKIHHSGSSDPTVVKELESDKLSP